MSKPDARRGHRSDEPTGRVLWQVRPAGHLDRVVVRTDSSYAKAIDSNAAGATGSSRSQSERDLAVPEAAGRRAEGRASGKSGAARSDRRETSGGVEAVPSAGWREVAYSLNASEGQHHE